jgi:hypothetical protein
MRVVKKQLNPSIAGFNLTPLQALKFRFYLPGSQRPPVLMIVGFVLSVSGIIGLLP